RRRARRRPRALRARDEPSHRVPARMGHLRLVARLGAAAADTAALPQRRRPARRASHGDEAAPARRSRRRRRPGRHGPDADRIGGHPLRGDRAGQSDRRRDWSTMTREIIEAVRTIEREKGIDGDTLIHALEDALLAAYKKTPGASRHATVELDDDGD